MNRRSFLQSAALQVLSNSPPFEPWTPGTLDIHHLAYGRGNSTFVLCPDGTTLLIDAGTNDDSLDVSCAQKPNDHVSPGAWIAAYILRQMKAAGRKDLDYFLLTHLHPDHLGAVMDVDARVRIARFIDRGFPDYQYPLPQKAPFAVNYTQYARSRGQRARVGRGNQIRLLREPARYPDFVIRNLAANGDVWTGNGDGTRQYFPPGAVPTENMCSIAIRLSYGKFDYYTGGDLTCDTEETAEPWRDIETPVARAAGPVEVAVANHHGYFDAVGPAFLRETRPRVCIIPAWYVAHPCILPLRRMVQHSDVFVTNLMPANRAVNNQFVSKLKSLEGHVVVRVATGGADYRVIILDNADDSDRMKAVFGPYLSS
jgi:beta-lactamase superfamily II metal-dependent hydrolase